MEVKIDVEWDSNEDSAYSLVLSEDAGGVTMEIKTYGEDREIKVDAAKLRRALEAIKEDW